jgi:hypothetical protein
MVFPLCASTSHLREDAGVVSAIWGKCRTGGLLVADLAEAQDLRAVEFSGFDAKGEGRMRATIAANTPTTR